MIIRWALDALPNALTREAEGDFTHTHTHTHTHTGKADENRGRRWREGATRRERQQTPETEGRGMPSLEEPPGGAPSSGPAQTSGPQN